MKAYVTDTHRLSKAMMRVEGALRAHAQEHKVEIVEDVKEADVVLLHTIGYPETVKSVHEARERGQDVVIIQYCLKSTQKQDVASWAPIWSECLAVWSYYDLAEMAFDEGVTVSSLPTFYCSPLGVDPIFCQPWKPVPRPFTILTSGYVAESEAVTECTEAARQVGGVTFHLGPRDVAVGEHVASGLNIPDPELRARYLQSQFVAGLRRGEGFEFPVIEGFMNGCRPICFDRPHYRRWFEGMAEFVPEVEGPALVAALREVFEAGARPVTSAELLEAHRKFNWSDIVGGLWRLVGSLR